MAGRVIFKKESEVKQEQQKKERSDDYMDFLALGRSQYQPPRPTSMLSSDIVDTDGGRPGSHPIFSSTTAEFIARLHQGNPGGWSKTAKNEVGVDEDGCMPYAKAIATDLHKRYEGEMVSDIDETTADDLNIGATFKR